MSHGTMIGGHSWQKIRGKTVILSRVCKTCFEESDRPRPKKNIMMLIRMGFSYVASQFGSTIVDGPDFPDSETLVETANDN